MKLAENYPDPVQAALAQMAFLESTNERGIDAEYDDGDALFMMLCRGVRMYVDAWAAAGQPGIGGLVADAADLEDPMGRLADPHALVRTLLALTMDSISDNITHDLDAEIERGEAS